MVAVSGFSLIRWWEGARTGPWTEPLKPQLEGLCHDRELRHNGARLRHTSLWHDCI